MESGWVRVPKNTLDPPDKYPIIGVGVVTDCKEGLILRFTPQCAYLRYTLLRGPSPGAPSTTTRFSHAYSICVRRSCGALAGLAVQTCAICMAGAGPPRSQPAGCEGGGIQGPTPRGPAGRETGCEADLGFKKSPIQTISFTFLGRLRGLGSIRSAAVLTAFHYVSDYLCLCMSS